MKLDVMMRAADTVFKRSRQLPKQTEQPKKNTENISTSFAGSPVS
jgi:hypothetical protein